MRPCLASSTTCSSTGLTRGGRIQACEGLARSSARGCGSSSIGRRGPSCSRRWRRCSGCAEPRRRLASRIALAGRRFTRGMRGAVVATLALIVAVGGFIFYNTNVLNAYTPAAAGIARRAEYEKRYGQYRNVPQPQLTGTTPESRDLPRTAHGRDPRCVRSGERDRRRHRHDSSRAEEGCRDDGRSIRSSCHGARCRRSARPSDLRLERAARSRRLAAARVRGAIRAARLLQCRTRRVGCVERRLLHERCVASRDRLPAGTRSGQCGRARGTWIGAAPNDARDG